MLMLFIDYFKLHGILHSTLSVFFFCLINTRTQSYLASLVSSLISKTFSCKPLENPPKAQEILPFQTSEIFLVTNVVS